MSKFGVELVVKIEEATDGNPEHYNLKVTQGGATLLYENLTADSTYASPRPPPEIRAMLMAMTPREPGMTRHIVWNGEASDDLDSWGVELVATRDHGAQHAELRGVR